MNSSNRSRLSSVGISRQHARFAIFAAQKGELVLKQTLGPNFSDSNTLAAVENPQRVDSQTTGLWLRGVLQEEYGLAPDQVRWITFEDAHVASFRDPPWAERAPAGSDMLALLRDGRLDAAIFGNELPTAENLATVFPDPAAAGQSFLARHHFMPVNHMLVVRAEVARTKGVVRALLDRCRAAGNPFPFVRTALDPAVSLALRYATERGLLERPLTLDEVWTGLPPGCEE